MAHQSLWVSQWMNDNKTLSFILTKGVDMIACVSVWERERDKERDRDRDKERERDTDRQTDEESEDC